MSAAALGATTTSPARARYFQVAMGEGRDNASFTPSKITMASAPVTWDLADLTHRPTRTSFGGGDMRSR